MGTGIDRQYTERRGLQLMTTNCCTKSRWHSLIFGLHRSYFKWS